MCRQMQPARSRCQSIEIDATTSAVIDNDLFMAEAVSTDIIIYKQLSPVDINKCGFLSSDWF